MKKFTKIILLIILITSIVGIGLMSVGLLFGVPEINRDVVNSPLYHKLVKAWRNHEMAWRDFDNSGYENANSRIFHSSEVDSIEIEGYGGTVQLRTIPEDEIRISGLSGEDFLELDSEDKELKMESVGNDYGNAYDIIIEVPENKVYSSLDVQMEAGEFRSIGKLSVKECDFSLLSGNMQIGLLDTQDMELEMSSGNFSVTQIGKLDDYEIGIECASGQLTLNGEEYIGTVNNHYGTLGSSRKMEIESSSGIIDVNFKNQ